MKGSGRLLTLLLLVAAGTARATDPGIGSPAVPWPRVRVRVAGTPILAEVADTPDRRRQGLSGRESLAKAHGMLFPYPRPDRYAFWMKGMRFDLDILWARSGRIVHIQRRAPHRVTDPLPIYRPREPADLVLEVPAGTATRLRWRVGDPVVVEPLEPQEGR